MTANDDRNNYRFASIEDKLSTVLERLAASDPQGITSMGTGDLSGVGGVVPMRGQHGECPAISIRYAYIEEKLRTEALAGTLAPDKLPFLLPDASPLAVAGIEDGDEFTMARATDGSDPLVYKTSKSSSAHTLVKFQRGPTPTVFAAAWGIFTDLMLHGLRAYDAQTVADAHSALRHHEFWVLERSKDFTWESICAYHLSVAAERLASGFRCELWYKNIDADLWVRLQQRKSAVTHSAKHQASTATSSADKSRRLPPSSDQVCNNYNMGFCKSASCSRRHVCKTCEGEGQGRRQGVQSALGCNGGCT